MKDEATHQPILFEVIKKTTGPILELGAGHSSTEQIHALAPKRHILTVDDHQEWLDNFKHLANKYHKFELFNEWLFAIHGLDWDVVLIDLSTWEQRLWAIEKLRFHAKYLVIHDAQKRKLGRYFNYSREYRVPEYEFPTTLLGSNQCDLKKIIVEGAIIIKG